MSRVRLLDWLEASAATPVIAICATAGYGKPVLAVERAKRDPRPFVWLSIDRHDNDPTALLTYLAVGLDRVEPIDPTVLGVLASRGPGSPRRFCPGWGPRWPARPCRSCWSWTMCTCSMTRRA